MKKYLIFSMMGMELVGLILASVYLGELFDNKQQAHGLYTSGFCFLSLVAWFVQIIVLIKKTGSF